MLLPLEDEMDEFGIYEEVKTEGCSKGCWQASLLRPLESVECPEVSEVG
jgi:hypothetical protein